MDIRLIFFETIQIPQKHIFLEQTYMINDGI